MLFVAGILHIRRPDSICEIEFHFHREMSRIAGDARESLRRMLGLARKVETEMNESWYEDFYHHLRMEMDEYRRLKRNLRVLKSYTDYEEDLYEEAV